MSAYYNEIDPYAARWLRNLIAAGHIAPGDVDERSIEDVRPIDLLEYDQCHFFAGIGGWSLALRLADWPDDKPVWTGSCPCQPFSVAGKQASFSDKRHLWPVWERLIAELKPSMVYGEQVAAATDWLSLVRRDLEALGYAVGGIPMEAASAHADHFRDRYWFVADRDVSRWQGRIGVHEQERAVEQPVGSSGAALRLGALVNDQSLGWGEGWTEDELRRGGFAAPVASLDGLQFVQCPDGKWRRLPPPGVRWLGNAIPSRVAKLRAFGNAIVPEAAAEFILATRP